MEVPRVTENTAMLLLWLLPVLATIGILFSAWQLGVWSRLSGFRELDEEPPRWPVAVLVISLLALGGWLGWRHYRGLPLLPPEMMRTVAPAPEPNVYSTVQPGSR